MSVFLHVVGACRRFWRLGRFFNGHWQEVAAKDTLSRYVSKLTGIPESVLVTPLRKVIYEFPIARRISCIAGRQTTRIETIPYSLPGILSIHMPMLYGEGAMAFQRLHTRGNHSEVQRHVSFCLYWGPDPPLDSCMSWHHLHLVSKPVPFKTKARPAMAPCTGATG